MTANTLRAAPQPELVAEFEPAEPDHAITDAELARVLEILQGAAARRAAAAPQPAPARGRVAA